MIIFASRTILFLIAVALGSTLPSAPAIAGPVSPHIQLLPLFPSASDAEAGSNHDVLLWQVQSCDGDYCKEEPTNGKSRNRYGTNLNKGTTADIAEIIRDANKTCNERIERRYRVDCLRIYYGWVADSLPDSGEYLPIKQAMRKAEKKLSAIVSANVDRKAPVITPHEGHKKNAPRMPPLRPVKKSAVKKAVAQAEAVVKETEIVILRSGEDPTRRTAHYEEVAAAVDSNLVILRSA
ncbi:MAG: hypothetical protein WAS26_06875 [Paracoccaceae bacterium]